MSHVQFGLIVLKEGKALAQGLSFVMSWLAYSCRCDRYILRLTSIITYSGSCCSLWLVTGSFLHPDGLATSSCTYITHPFFFKEITMGQNIFVWLGTSLDCVFVPGKKMKQSVKYYGDVS